MHQQRDGVPDFLRVEEAARVLRIGRTSAYDLARQFTATGGAAGLPVIRVGKLLRVPRRRLEELTGGPLTWPPSSVDVISDDVRLQPVPAPSRASTRGAAQSTLPFAG